MRWTKNKDVQRLLLFSIGGAINTGLTYALYLLLKLLINYQVAYAIAYASGIVFSYWFNSVFVFRVSLSWQGIFTYPLVYIVQYLVAAFFLGGLVEYFDVDENIAPIMVMVVMFPVTYLMSKFFLIRKVSR